MFRVLRATRRAGLAVVGLLLTSAPALAWGQPGAYGIRGPASAFPPGFFPPSHYGYRLDDPAPGGYYGGIRSREYYNYGFGIAPGIGIADFPPPLPGPVYYDPARRKPLPGGYPSVALPPVLPNGPPPPTVLPPAAPALPQPTPLPASVAKNAAAPVTGPRPTVFTIHVPENAEVWIEGSATTQRGTVRPFESPPLEPGKRYVYEIRARWTEDGQVVEQTREIAVQAGDRPEVRFPDAVAAKPGTLSMPRAFPVDAGR